MQDSTTTDQTEHNETQEQVKHQDYSESGLDAIDALLQSEPEPDKDKDTDTDQAKDGDGQGPDDADDGDDPDADPDADNGDGDADKKDPDGYSQEVVLADGSKKTVGELKDFYQQQAIRELDLIERESALIAKMEEESAIAEALNVIPAHIRDQVIAERQAVYGREYGKVMTLIPAWKDRATYEEDRREIYAMAEKYGLGEVFEKVVDARAVKFLYDTANLHKRIKAAGYLIKQQAKNTGKPRPGHKPANTQTAATRQAELINKAKAGSIDDKHNAISSLLGG